ncbi:hypothetical protein J6590_021652 [Homalodisca vitripennis]|nr:hypothetical protein J6590_021652 [Homalodisca vitripennis]
MSFVQFLKRLKAVQSLTISSQSTGTVPGSILPGRIRQKRAVRNKSGDEIKAVAAASPSGLPLKPTHYRTQLYPHYLSCSVPQRSSLRQPTWTRPGISESSVTLGVVLERKQMEGTHLYINSSTKSVWMKEGLYILYRVNILAELRGRGGSLAGRDNLHQNSGELAGRPTLRGNGTNLTAVKLSQQQQRQGSFLPANYNTAPLPTVNSSDLCHLHSTPTLSGALWILRQQEYSPPLL